VNFTNPAGLLLVGLLVPVLALHVLRPRRESRAVSSTFLWRELASPVSAARPWQRLRPTWQLLLQVLAVIALALAVAQPVRLTPAPLAAHTVFMVDASGSMGATDGQPDRLEDARARARDLRAQLPADGVASVVVITDHPRVLLTASPDRDAFEAALTGIRTSPGTADFAGAFALASSLETPGVGIGFVLLSDGGVDDEGRLLIPPGTRYETVGSQSDNRAITRLSVEQRGSGLHVRANVANTGGTPSTPSVRYDVDGRTARRTQVPVAAGEARDVEADLPGGTKVEASLEGADLLPADDHRVAVAGGRRGVKVLVSGPANAFLDAVLSITPGVTVERTAQPQPVGQHDLAIYDRVPVPTDPGGPFLAIAPPGGVPDVAVDGDLDRPAVALVRTDDPLLDNVDLSALAILRAQRLRAPRTETLIGAEGAPLLVRGVQANQPFLYLGFDLRDSNLPLGIALPVLIDRAVTQLAASGVPPADLIAGETLPVPPGLAVTAVDPQGHETHIAAGGTAPIAAQPGFWALRPDGGADQAIAVNVSTGESSLRPVPELPIAARPARPGEQPLAGEVSLLALVVPVLVMLILAEWWLARRRVGVAKRQWRAAVVLRALLVALLIVAVAGLGFVHDADRVATVFVLDGSDSMSGSGRTEALTWVKEALAHQPDGSASGVAVFGRDARVELTVRERQELGQPAVRIDSSRTNLATALRLAAALLPEDARRRVVVVSDGRITEGDTTLESGRLADAGIQVDVHTVEARRGADVAVGAVDGPARARPGDRVDLQARIESTVSAPAVVTLDRDGTELDQRTVDLVVGSNPVSFTVVVPPGDAGTGLERYRVRVSSPADTIIENNQGFAPVQIEGVARVLVAEGEGLPGAGRPVAEALRAGNLAVDLIGAADLPAIDGLAPYSSIVLVDVDAQDLTTDQVGALSSSTRDLGHGLVTIGGEHAYGLGGYLHSPLEELLPVVSEVKDPNRRQRVAQVLAIDTSGSMGECACGPDGVGATKSDLSRAGADRAIAVLRPDDEVGILSVSDQDEWFIDLQPVPPPDVLRAGIGRLVPGGGTNLSTLLTTSADALRKNSAGLKHIILFTDGMTAQSEVDALARQAADLHDREGMTVSVLAAGQDANRTLKEIADAGHGRYYPGKDLRAVPQIMQDEVVRVSRGLVNEGEWAPEITSADEVVRELRAAPALLGYVATTTKSTATTQMRIGTERDPLLASWQVGLGRATAWTSDSGQRWAQRWAGWNGNVAFWTGVVKATLPSSSGRGGVIARLDGGRLKVRIETEGAFPDGATGTVRITGPDQQGHDVAVVRTDASTFQGELPVSQSGTYAVGARITAGDSTVLASSTIASQAYSAEYRPGAADPGALAQVAGRTGGRAEVAADAVFDPGTLVAGRARVPLAGWSLLAAALIWPLALALSRLSLRRRVRIDATGSVGSSRLTDRLGRARGRRPGVRVGGISLPDRGGRARPIEIPEPSPPPTPAGKGAPPSTLDQLLARKRGTKSR
jgi:Ca-activated chloride channel family protein